MYPLMNIPEELFQAIITKLADNTLKTPQTIISLATIKRNYTFFKDVLSLDDNSIFYATKANSNLQIINYLKNLGCGFEIASLGELQNIKAANVEPTKVLFSNPVKIPQHIAAAVEYGIDKFAFDTESELKKIANYAPNATVYLRTVVSNEGAEWSLSGKFGVKPSVVPDLLQLAYNYGLKPEGITLHIGWNNCNLSTWETTLSIICDTIEKCLQRNIPLKFLDLGGGFPAHNVQIYNMLESIATKITPFILRLKNDYGLQVYAEPGSYLVHNAGATLTRIYDIVKRDDKELIFIDTGINQGFYWIYCGINYNIIYPQPLATANFQTFTITGPTCDSHDIFAENIELPASIKPDDVLAIFPSGAYVTAAANYNGFNYPDIAICD